MRAETYTFKVKGKGINEDGKAWESEDYNNKVMTLKGEVDHSIGVFKEIIESGISVKYVVNSKTLHFDFPKDRKDAEMNLTDVNTWEGYEIAHTLPGKHKIEVDRVQPQSPSPFHYGHVGSAQENVEPEPLPRLFLERERKKTWIK